MNQEEIEIKPEAIVNSPSRNTESMAEGSQVEQSVVVSPGRSDEVPEKLSSPPSSTKGAPEADVQVGSNDPGNEGDGQAAENEVTAKNKGTVAKAKGKNLKAMDGQKMEIGQSIPYLTSEEATMHVEQFDLFKFDRRIRQVVTELVKPLQYDQKEVLTQQNDLRHRQLLMEQQVKESISKLERGHAKIEAFGSYDKMVLGLDKAHKDFVDLMETQLLKKTKETQWLKGEVSKQESQIKSMKQDIVRALRHQHVDTEQLSRLIAQYKSDCQEYFAKYTTELGGKLQKVDYNYNDMRARVEDSLRKYRSCHKAMLRSEEESSRLQGMVLDVRRANEELAQVHTFEPRINHIETQMRQMRILVQQSVLDTRESLTKSVTQSQLEETILHYNFNMLEGIFGQELKRGPQKLDLVSRLKLNYTDWQMKIKEKYDLGKYTDDPTRHAVFLGRLPKYGELRKFNLLEHLKNQQLDSKARKRLMDSSGVIRSNSIMAVKDGVIIRRSEPLEEQPIIYRDFLCDKPKHGYVPRFCQPPREVEFVPPKNPFGSPEKLKQEPSLRAIPDSDGSRNVVGSLSSNQGSSFQKSKNEKLRDEYDQKYLDAMLEYQKEVKLAEEEAMQEYWNGQKISLDLGIVSRKVHLKRMHSCLGHGDDILIQGQRKPPLIQLPDSDSDSDSSYDEEESSGDDYGELTHSPAITQRKSIGVGLDSANKKYSIQGSRDSRAVGGHDPISTVKIAQQTYKIASKMERAIKMKTTRDGTKGKDQGPSNSARRLAEQFGGEDEIGGKKKKKAKVKVKSKDGHRGRGPKTMKRQEFLKDQVTRWGMEYMSKTPHCPKGMQFVNTDYLVDALELNRLEETIKKLLENELDERQTIIIEKLDRDMQRQNDDTTQRFEQQSIALSKSAQQYVDDRMAGLDAARQEQDLQIAKIRRHQEETGHDLKLELSKKFVQQSLYNDALNDKMKQTVKKLHMMKSDLEGLAKEIKEESRQTKNYVEKTMSQLRHLYDLIQCMVEVTFLDNIVQIQDEFDRNQLSLWGINEYKKSGMPIPKSVANQPMMPRYQPSQPLQQPDTNETNGSNSEDISGWPKEDLTRMKPMADYGQEPYVQVDEDCLSCSLDKYRPMIKEAFKMACLQYKPTAVPFKGYSYGRKNLLELKHKILQKRWIEVIQRLDYYSERFSHIISRSGGDQNDNDDYILAEHYLQFFSDNLHVKATQEYGDVIDELVFNHSLKEQIIKNPSNVGLLYKETSDQMSLNHFKEQLKFDPEVMKSYKNFVIKTAESQKSLSKLDRKTLSVIQQFQDGGDKDKTQRDGSKERSANYRQSYELLNKSQTSKGLMDTTKAPPKDSARAIDTNSIRKFQNDSIAKKAVHTSITDLDRHIDQSLNDQIDKSPFQSDRKNSRFKNQMFSTQNERRSISKQIMQSADQKKQQHTGESKIQDEEVYTQENFHKTQEQEQHQKALNQELQKLTESFVASTDISKLIIKDGGPQQYKPGKELGRQHMNRASISIGQIKTSLANQGTKALLNDNKRSSLPEIKPSNVDLLQQTSDDIALASRDSGFSKYASKRALQSNRRIFSKSVMFDSVEQLKMNADLQFEQSKKKRGQLGSSDYKIQNESIQRINYADVDRRNALSHLPDSSTVALNKQIAQPLKGKKVINFDKGRNLSSQRTEINSLNDFSMKSSRNYQDRSRLTSNVQEAISELRKNNKSSLVDLMKHENRLVKKMDNAAVVRGTTKNLMIQDFERQAKKEKRRQGEPQMAIHKLDVDKIRGFTNGYLYSQGKDGLLESLRGPFANRGTSPLKQLQQMYEKKNAEILNQSQFYMNIKLEKDAIMKQQLSRKRSQGESVQDEDFQLPSRRYSRMNLASETAYDGDEGGKRGKSDSMVQLDANDIHINSAHQSSAVTVKEGEKRSNYESGDHYSTQNSNENLDMPAMLTTPIIGDLHQMDISIQRDRDRLGPIHSISSNIKVTSDLKKDKSHSQSSRLQYAGTSSKPILAKRKEDSPQKISRINVNEQDIVRNDSALQGIDLAQIRTEIKYSVSKAKKEDRLRRKAREERDYLHDTLKEAVQELGDQDPQTLSKIYETNEDQRNQVQIAQKQIPPNQAINNTDYQSQKQQKKFVTKIPTDNVDEYLLQYSETQKELVSDEFGLLGPGQSLLKLDEVKEYIDDGASIVKYGWQETMSRKNSSDTNREDSDLAIKGKKAVVGQRDSNQVPDRRIRFAVNQRNESISTQQKLGQDEANAKYNQRVRQLQMHGHRLAAGGQIINIQEGSLNSSQIPSEIVITPFRGDDQSRMTSQHESATNFEKKKPFQLKQRKESKQSKVGGISHASMTAQSKYPMMKNIYGKDGSGDQQPVITKGSREMTDQNVEQPGNRETNGIDFGAVQSSNQNESYLRQSRNLSELSGFNVKARDSSNLGQQFQRNFQRDYESGPRIPEPKLTLSLNLTVDQLANYSEHNRPPSSDLQKSRVNFQNNQRALNSKDFAQQPDLLGSIKTSQVYKVSKQ